MFTTDRKRGKKDIEINRRLMYMVPINLGFYYNPILIEMKGGWWQTKEDKAFGALMPSNCLVVKGDFISTILEFIYIMLLMTLHRNHFSFKVKVRFCVNEY